MLTLPAVELNAVINGVGTSSRQAVRMASTGHLTIPMLISGNIIDGIALKENDRILIKNQIPIQQQIAITTLADVNGSLSGKYLLFSSTLKDYYLWFNTGSSVNPLISRRTGISVSVSINDTAIAIAIKINIALSAYSDFNKVLLGNIVRLTNTAIGACALPGGNTMQPISILAYGSDEKGNGVYECLGNVVSRSVDFDSGCCVGGAVIVVKEGSIQADTMWMCSNDSPLDVIDTHSITWIKVSQNEVLTNKGDVLTHNGTNSARLPIGIDGTVLIADSSTTSGIKWDVPGFSLSTSYAATIWDEKTTGTTGGASNANAWITRTLNKLQDTDLGTELKPSPKGISLSKNIIIVPPGTYLISALVPVFKVDGVKLRLITSSGTVLAYSISQTVANASQTNNFNISLSWCGKFLLETQLEIQQYSLRTQSDGCGLSSGIPCIPEIYTVVTMQKI